MENTESTIGEAYEKMLADAMSQPGVAMVMDTMRLVQRQQETAQLLVASTGVRVTAGMNSAPSQLAY